MIKMSVSVMMVTKDSMSLEMLKAIFATPWGRARLPEEDRSEGKVLETDWAWISYPMGVSFLKGFRH